MAKKKCKVVKVKARAVRIRPTRISKGVEHPWEVWCLDDTTGYHVFEEERDTEIAATKSAEAFPPDMKPVVLHLDIPRVRY